MIFLLKNWTYTSDVNHKLILQYYSPHMSPIYFFVAATYLEKLFFT